MKQEPDSEQYPAMRWYPLPTVGMPNIVQDESMGAAPSGEMRESSEPSVRNGSHMQS